MNCKKEKFFSKEITKSDLLILDILIVIGLFSIVFCGVLIILTSKLY